MAGPGDLVIAQAGPTGPGSGGNAPRIHPARPQTAEGVGASPSGSAIGIDPRLLEAWEGWKEAYLVNLSEGTLVKDPSQSDQVVSEGMGYALWTAIAMNDQVTFDRVVAGLKYFKKDDKDNHLHAWRLDKTGRKIEEKSATDADLYIAASLILAARNVQEGKWRRTAKSPDYAGIATPLIKSIWEKEIVQRGNVTILKPSDDRVFEWDDGSVAWNPSYFVPLLLEIVASADSHPDHSWRNLIRDGYKLLNLTLRNSAALAPKGKNPIPDWVLLTPEGDGVQPIQYPAKYLPPNTGELDAIRVPMEISKDALVMNRPEAVAFLTAWTKATGVKHTGEATLLTYNNEMAISTYGLAFRGANPGGSDHIPFSQAMWTFHRGKYFGFSERDRQDYYKQSITLQNAIFLEGKQHALKTIFGPPQSGSIIPVSGSSPRVFVTIGDFTTRPVINQDNQREIAGVGVYFKDQNVFTFYGPSSRQSTADRAETLARGLAEAQAEKLFYKENIGVNTTPSGWAISVDDIPLLEITPSDASIEGKSFDALLGRFIRRLIDTKISDPIARQQVVRDRLEAFTNPRTPFEYLRAFPYFTQIRAEKTRDLAHTIQNMGEAPDEEKQTVVRRQKVAIATFARVLQTKPDYGRQYPIFYFEVLLNLGASIRNLGTNPDSPYTREVLLPEIQALETTMSCVANRQNTAACFSGGTPVADSKRIRLSDAQTLPEISRRIFRYIYEQPHVSLGYRARALREWGATRHMELLMGMITNERQVDQALRDIPWHYEASLTLNLDGDHPSLLVRPLREDPDIRAMTARLASNPHMEHAYYYGKDYRMYEDTFDAVGGFLAGLIGSEGPSPNGLHEVAKAALDMGDYSILAQRIYQQRADEAEIAKDIPRAERLRREARHYLGNAKGWTEVVTKHPENIFDRKEFRLYQLKAHLRAGEALIIQGDSAIRLAENEVNEEKREGRVGAGMGFVMDATTHFVRAAEIAERLVHDLETGDPIAAQAPGAFWEENDYYHRSRVSLQNALLRTYYYLEQGHSVHGDREAAFRDRVIHLLKQQYQQEVDPSTARAESYVAPFQDLSLKDLTARMTLIYDKLNIEDLRSQKIKMDFVRHEATIGHAETLMRPLADKGVAIEQAHKQDAAVILDRMIAQLSRPENERRFNYLLKRAKDLRAELRNFPGQDTMVNDPSGAFPGAHFYCPDPPDKTCLATYLDTKDFKGILSLGPKLIAADRNMSNKDKAYILWHMALAHLNLLHERDAERLLQQVVDLPSIQPDLLRDAKIELGRIHREQHQRGER